MEDIRLKYYSDIPRNKFLLVVKSDPTTTREHILTCAKKTKLKLFGVEQIVKNDKLVDDGGKVVKLGQYCRWLLNLFRQKKLKIEDLYKAKEYLTVFDKLKSKNLIPADKKDIGQIKSLPELYQLNIKIGGSGKITNDEKCLIEDRFFINSGQAKLIFENKKWLIVSPLNLKASEFYGHCSEWCTVYSDNFKHYSKNGQLYIFINKKHINTEKERRRMQFHFQSDQFMDMLDEEIPNTTITRKNFLKKIGLLRIYKKIRRIELNNTIENNLEMDSDNSIPKFELERLTKKMFNKFMQQILNRYGLGYDIEEYFEDNDYRNKFSKKTKWMLAEEYFNDNNDLDSEYFEIASKQTKIDYINNLFEEAENSNDLLIVKRYEMEFILKNYKNNFWKLLHKCHTIFDIVDEGSNSYLPELPIPNNIKREMAERIFSKNRSFYITDWHFKNAYKKTIYNHIQNMINNRDEIIEGLNVEFEYATKEQKIMINEFARRPSTHKVARKIINNKGLERIKDVVDTDFF